MAKCSDRTFEQGAEFILEVQWLQPNGAPVDISGFSFVFEARKSPDDADSLLRLTDVGGGITATITDARIVVKMSGEETEAVPAWSSARYELLAFNSTSGVARRLVRGQLTYSKAIAKR